MDLNERIFRAINGWPREWEPFMRFFAEATTYRGVQIALLALVVYLIVRKGRYRMAALGSLIAVILANSTTDLFKKFIPLPRPCNVIADVVNHGIGCSGSMGTASAHSANMAAVAFVFTAYLGRWGWPWIAVALITGISRSYHGAHYPAQVLAGWLTGCGYGALVVWVGRLIERKPATVSTEKTDEIATP